MKKKLLMLFKKKFKKQDKIKNKPPTIKQMQRL